MAPPVPPPSAEALRRSEARYRFLSEASSEAIGVHTEGVMVDCNQAMETLLGVPRDQIIGQKFLSFVAPESRESAIRQIGERSESQYELFIVRPDGERRAVESRARNIDIDGKTSRVGALRDITDTIAAEKELRFQQTLLDETQTFAHVGSWEMDLGTGLMRGTAETRRLFSLDTGEEASQESLLAHTHPEDRARMQEALAVAVDRGAATVETRIVRRDGSIRWVLTQKEVRRNDAGRPVRLVGISQDITNRKLREDAAIEGQRRLASLLDNLSDVFYSVDAATHEVLMISKACETLYGLPAKAFYDDPRQWVDLVHPDDAARVLASDEAARRGTAQDIRYRIRRADGAARSVRARMIPLLGADGSVLRIEGYVSDVTAETHAESQRLKVRELEQVAAFKTDLLNATSHELNTPLAALKLQLYLHRIALGERINEADIKSLDMMERNVTRLATLVHENLVVSRIQSKTLRLNMSRVALDEIVQDTLEQMRPIADKAGVTLHNVHDGTVPLAADALRLSQVLFNLVGNALKFVGRGGTITVSTAYAGKMVRCSVTDSGAGLSPDQIAQLFQPFSQVHDAKEPRGGTGLGLFISRGIVERHGGRIWCESPGPGLGCTFHFEIPMHAARATSSPDSMPKGEEKTSREPSPQRIGGAPVPGAGG